MFTEVRKPQSQLRQQEERAFRAVDVMHLVAEYLHGELDRSQAHNFDLIRAHVILGKIVDDRERQIENIQVGSV